MTEMADAMVKGKYVATVEIDFAFDENGNCFIPFDEIYDAVQRKITQHIQEMLAEEFEGCGKITVKQMYADLYHVKIEE